jgi:hypothetical protein
VKVLSVLDRTPLIRLEYRADMVNVPCCHWQIHAERGAFTHLLAAAHGLGRVKKPHDLSALHIPVGGERFRPCLEDVLQFLVEDCGVDSVDGYSDVLNEGRTSWRTKQLASVVRDFPEEAARVLRDLQWQVNPPAGRDPEAPPRDALLRR